MRWAFTLDHLLAKVPHCDQSIVEAAKVAAYLLSATHPIGRAKARSFKQFGFWEDGPEELTRALLLHVRDNAVADTETSAYGTKYRVDGPLMSPDGRNPSMSSVWIVLDDQGVGPDRGDLPEKHRLREMRQGVVDVQHRLQPWGVWTNDMRRSTTAWLELRPERMCGITARLDASVR